MSVLLHIALRMCLSKSLKCETKICGSNTAERNKKRKWERERERADECVQTYYDDWNFSIFSHLSLFVFSSMLQK